MRTGSTERAGGPRLHQPTRATPLTPDELLGLKARHPGTRSALNELEGADIIEGLTGLDRRMLNL